MSLLKQPLFIIALLTLALAALIHRQSPPPRAPEIAAPVAMPVAKAPVSTPAPAPVSTSAPAPSLIASKRGAISETLAITGAVVNPRTLSVADLERFPPQQIGEFEMICESGANLGKRQNLRGVRLRDILEQAQLKALTPHHFRRMAIIARATDDYIAVFSWAEIFNSAVGDQVIVYFSKDGQPLDDSEGRIALISTTDQRTGPRHVRWLNEIEVRPLGR